MEQLNLLNLQSCKSPLTYIGGKRRLWSTISRLLPHNLKEIASPFVGGASIELAIAAQGVDVFCSDNHFELVNFWNYFKKDSFKICEIADSLWPMTQKNYDLLYEDFTIKTSNLIDPKDSLQLAVAFLLLNKSSFFGLISSNGFKKRITHNALYFMKSEWSNWNNDYFHIECLDCFDAIKKHENKFLFLDPPYVDKEDYYDPKIKKGSFDHKKLAEVLKRHKHGWLMTHERHPLIYDLYEGFEIINYEYINDMVRVKEKVPNKISKEIIIRKI